MSKFNLILKRTPSVSKGGPKVFGVALDQLVERQGSAIPEVVYQSVKCIEKGIETSGLFATTPKKVKVQLLRKQVEDADLDLSKSKDYHEVAEVLRSFFAELVDPLLPFKLYDSFISIAKMESGETKLQRLHIAYNALPPANRVILGFIVTFFRKCLEHRKNQVTPAVLGKSFGPAILRPRGDIGSQEMALIVSLTAYIVEEFMNLMKMASRAPESPSSQSSPPTLQDPFKTPSTTSARPSNSSTSATPATNATSATNITNVNNPAKSRPTTTPRSPRHIVSPQTASPTSPQTTPRASPTPASPRNAARAIAKPSATPKKLAPATTTVTTITPATPSTTFTTTLGGSQMRRAPSNPISSTPVATLSSTSPTTSLPVTTTTSSVRATATATATAQNIHQMQQQQLQNRLSQIQTLKQQREVIRTEQLKEKEQKEAREREQKEKEQKDIAAQSEKEKEEKEKKDKGNPAKHRLQRPAILRMKPNYDFEARDETEITVSVGGLVDVISKDESGWWWGRMVNGDGKVGLFPANYCEIVESFSPAARKFNISQLNLNPKIRDLQKECGFVKESPSTSQITTSSSQDPQILENPQSSQTSTPIPSFQMTPTLTQTPASHSQPLARSPSSQIANQVDDKQKPSSQQTQSTKQNSLRIQELQASMSKLKGFPGTSSLPPSPISPTAATSPSSPPISPTSFSFGSSLRSPISSSGRVSDGQRVTPSHSFTKGEAHRIQPSQSLPKSPSSSMSSEDAYRLRPSPSFGRSPSSEHYRLTPSRSFKGGDEEQHRLAPSASFSKKVSPSTTKDSQRRLKTRKDRKSQNIEELQSIMANMRGFPATPEAVRARQSRDSEPTFALHKTPSRSRVPSSRILNGTERLSANSKELLDRVIDTLNGEGEEPSRPSTPLSHLTLKRAKPTKRRPASIGSLRKLHSARSLETAEVVQETLQLLDAEVQKRQEMEALANEFRKEYEEEKKLRNQLEGENQFSSNLFDKIKAELEQQHHSVNMLHYEKDALESMTRQLKREAMDAVGKYEEMLMSKSSVEKEMEEMKRKMEELMNERDTMARERDKYKRECASLADDLKSMESKSRLDKSNTLEELSVSQKQALDLQAQVINHQKAKTEVQGRLDQALKELELAREREAKMTGSIQGERAELDRLRNGETERLQAMKSLEEQKATLESSVNTLKDACKEEQILRKKYFNMIEDMKGKIRVMCRTRPLASKEVSSGQKIACEFADPYSITISSSNQTKTFGFDRVFAPHTTQDEVFSDTSHLVQSSLDGYNVCLFAYGQTGSGKTHTLLGDDSNPGLCPRAMSLLFESIKRDESRFKVSVRCYLLELYNDNLVDLLLKRDEKPQKLIIKKDAKENATLRKASTSEKLRAFMMQGLKHRHTGATKMNDLSSRSHLIFSILIKSKNIQTKQYSTGKLSFVDLAGSERAARSGATDERLQEAKSINKSLSALGNVINALSTGESFVPYRNNKLTQLMSDSIGGNAKTLMMVNVAPGDANADESLQSLAYGQRAKLITNTATKMVETAEVQRLKKIIAQLRSERGEPAEQDEVLDVVQELNGADEDPLSDD